METAAFGDRFGARRIALEDDASVLFCPRHGRDQRFRIRVPRLPQDLARRPFLDDAAKIHDGQPIAHMFDDGEIMRDKNISEVEARLEFDQQVEDLRLDRHIERRNRLIENEQLRLESYGARYADA